MSLLVWLPLNGDLHNQGLHKYPITIFRGTETYNDQGKIGKCFYSNGVNTIKILDIIPDFLTYTSYSLCAWFYIETNNTTHSGSVIISAGDWNDQVLNLSLSDWSTDHYTRLRVSGTNWNNWYNYNFNKNTWYHVVVCSDGNKTYAYVNGNLIGDTIAGFLPSSISGHDICIGGATYYSGMQFFGKINDVRIYDHCLSLKEVEEIAKGLVLHYKLNNNGLGGENLFSWANNVTGITLNNYLNTGSFTQFTNSLLFDPSLTVGEKYTISFWAKSPNGTTSLLLYNSNGNPKYFYFSTTLTSNLSTEWQFFKYTVTNTQYNGSNTPSTNSSIWKRIEIYAPNKMGVIVKLIKVEKGEITTQWSPAKADIIYPNIIYDSSGYGNNGTIVGSLEATTPSPKYSCATYINSPDPTTNSSTGEYYISANCNLTTPSAISIAWWSYPESGYSGSCSNGIWSTTANNIASDYQESAFNHRDTGFDVNSSDGTHLRLSTSSFVANAWHHYVVTYDGLTTKLYKDGVQQSSTAFAATKTLGSFSKILIGHSRAGGVHRKVKGKYSDFRVYATALTEAQIKELYKISMRIDGTNIIPRDLE